MTIEVQISFKLPVGETALLRVSELQSEGILSARAIRVYTNTNETINYSNFRNLPAAPVPSASDPGAIK